jgi:hypothetical protein
LTVSEQESTGSRTPALAADRLRRKPIVQI